MAVHLLNRCVNYGFRFEESVPMSGLWQSFMFESEFETTRC